MDWLCIKVEKHGNRRKLEPPNRSCPSCHPPPLVSPFHSPPKFGTHLPISFKVFIFLFNFSFYSTIIEYFLLSTRFPTIERILLKILCSICNLYFLHYCWCLRIIYANFIFWGFRVFMLLYPIFKWTCKT